MTGPSRNRQNHRPKDDEVQGFATDKEISSWRTAQNASGAKPRQLSRWDAEQGEKLVGEEFDREARLGASWDQFEVNQKLFGVITSFDESIYTTTLDKSAPDFRDKEVEAHRLAKEIMENAGNTANLHLAEERGFIDGAEYDEEDRYGAVIREASDMVGVVQMPRLSRHRKSITNMNADSSSLQAALNEIDQVTKTVTRRLSQINEADLSNILADEGRNRLELKKELKLNPDAEEFIPSFEVEPPAPFPPAPYPPGPGYYNPDPYHDPSVYYADPNVYYDYGQSGYYPYYHPGNYSQTEEPFGPGTPQ